MNVTKQPFYDLSVDCKQQQYQNTARCYIHPFNPADCGIGGINYIYDKHQYKVPVVIPDRIALICKIGSYGKINNVGKSSCDRGPHTLVSRHQQQISRKITAYRNG